MRFQTFFSLAVTLCALPVVLALLEGAQATGAIQALIDDVNKGKAQLVAIQDPGIVDSLLGGLAPVSVEAIIDDVQSAMGKCKTTFGSSWICTGQDGESPLFKKGDGSGVYERTLDLIVAFSQFFTELIDVYEYEFAKVQSEASTVHDQLVKLGPDDQEGNGVHTVFNRIGYWLSLDPIEALGENTRPLIHYHIPLCIRYWGRQVAQK